MKKLIQILIVCGFFVVMGGTASGDETIQSKLKEYCKVSSNPESCVQREDLIKRFKAKAEADAKLAEEQRGIREKTPLLALVTTKECPECDLSNQNLTSSSLSGANLKGANLEGTNLTNTNLENANLEGTNLTNANLESANLEGANLTGANISGLIINDKTMNH